MQVDLRTKGSVPIINNNDKDPPEIFMFFYFLIFVVIAAPKYIICENVNCLTIMAHEMKPCERRKNRRTDCGVFVRFYGTDYK